MAFKENLRETAKILGVNVGVEDIDTDDLLAEINKVLPAKINTLSSEVKLVASMQSLTDDSVVNVILNNSLERGKNYLVMLDCSGDGTFENSIMAIPYDFGIAETITTRGGDYIIRLLVYGEYATTLNRVEVPGLEKDCFVNLYFYELPFAMPTLA